MKIDKDFTLESCREKLIRSLPDKDMQNPDQAMGQRKRCRREGHLHRSHYVQEGLTRQKTAEKGKRSLFMDLLTTSSPQK